MTGPADVWTAAFVKPSKLWQPAPSWKPHEWTPLRVALGRIKDRVDDFVWGEIDLHQDLVAGRVKSALRYLLSDTGTKEIRLLLQPKFWQHLKITAMGASEPALVDGNVEGQPLEIFGGCFFVRTVDLDEHYPVTPAARPPDVVQPHAGGRKRSVRLAKELMAAVFPEGEWRRMGPVAVRKRCEPEAEARQVELPSADSFSRAMGRRSK
jgi:hypothetical protein